MWSSNAPWSSSGYGQQTALFVPRIKELGHDVAIAANWGLQGAGLEWHGLRVYPSDEKWGNEALVEYAAHHAGGNPADCHLITLCDVYVMLPERIALMAPTCWTPVDHDPVPPKVVRMLRESGARPVAMSRFGQAQLQDAGLDAMYVPHAVDTSVFAPHTDRAAVREAMGVPDDAFVVGMVAANTGNTPPRKSFPQVFKAFAELHRKHPDSILFLHTEVTGRNMGLDMLRLAEACGIPSEAVGSSDQLLMRLGFIEPERMALLYATMDVLANPAMGEGFGVPIVEAQACGVPVIVSDHSAMPELCGAGWKVGGDPAWNESQASWFISPSVGEVTDALLAAYDEAAGLRLQAEAFAQDYDADSVLHRYWVPVLDMMETPREVGPIVKPNRAARRAKAKQKVPA